MSLKKNELEELKALLVEDKRRILKHLEEISASSGKGLEIDVGDQADIASLEINLSSLAKIGKREASLLKKIETSLTKLEDGTYGECDNCGEEIGVKRLLARPVATLCIDCKTEEESSERRYQDDDAEDEDKFSSDGS